MQVSLEMLHALVDVERGADRGGAEVNPKFHYRLYCFWGNLANHEIVEVKVVGSAEVEPIFYIGQDEEHLLFC